jgi:hypothetical protein
LTKETLGVGLRVEGVGFRVDLDEVGKAVAEGGGELLHFFKLFGLEQGLHQRLYR